ncbi:uncharacterized protein LOC126880248 isoform X2 [Diabrotica virgifera virgifera]|uniref:HTH CENPB-type domain-containing protein n=1 Tax=Diabrotica virgifera virgifera TaxID=50390 RepID=A0ABM5JPW0_DIAVI|nr:uncharacterized protein LOC126880248 isoform X2 [Diabrotica virgifera virgifera]
MPPIKGQMFRYTEEAMEKAIEEVLCGKPVSTTAKKYGIPRVTLLYKSKGKTPRKRKMGPEPYLKEDQEKILVKWITHVSRAGFPIQQQQLMSSEVLMKELNKQNPLKDDKPGRTWFTGFLKRNPEISNRVAQNLTPTRSAVTKEDIQKWFREVYNYFRENNYEEILNDPNRVFNADESAFFLNPKGNKVLARKGDKTVYQQVNPDEKECLTVLAGCLTGNAAGKLAPPMVIFKYERIPKELALSVPEEWGIGRSESGWMTGATFYEFITNIFDKWLTLSKISRPVFLFIDGHSSHLTLHTSRFCAEHGIILVALHPNATQLLQPMDVAVFRSLKGGWKNAVHQWRIENQAFPVLRKIHFCPLLKKVLEERLMPSILKNGFRKCGLVPWDVGAIRFNNEKIDISKKIQEVQEMEQGKNFIEKHIDKENLALFKTSLEWNNDNEDLSRFHCYKNICIKYSLLEEEINNLKAKQGAKEPDDEDNIMDDATYIEDIPKDEDNPNVEGNTNGLRQIATLFMSTS